MTALLAALLAATPAPPPTSGSQDPAQDAAATARWLLAPPGAQEILRERLVEVSGRFIGTPYVNSPLGEGEGKDPDPTLRFDAVDCLTYVEQVMALALSRSPSDMPALLSDIRYAEAPSYETRNHLMEAQWLPNNVAKGYLRPITQALAGADAQRVTKVITADSWAAPSSKLLDLPESHQPQGTFELDVVPLDKVVAVAKGAQAGTVVIIVREERARKVTRITHLGFLTHRRGRPVLRHAARSHYKQVVDEDFETFVLRNSKYGKWPVTGFAFYEVRAPDAEGDTPTASAAAP